MKLATSGAAKFTALRDETSIAGYQLRSFNSTWHRAQQLPFYKEWKSRFDLPSKINSLSELDQWPILSKDELRAREDLVSLTPGTLGNYRTSGSTGEPFGFPRGPGEIGDLYESTWSYRKANGLLPFDSFLLTANTISGAGVSGRAQWRSRIVRAAKDLAGNSWKVNGFIPTAEDADRAILAVRSIRPRYVVGYPSAVAAIARRAVDRGLTFPYMTHAILTSETVEDSDISVVRDGLSVRVLIEYGAIETGVIAGSAEDGDAWPLSVLWWRSLVRLGVGRVMTLTTLSERLFPLINYDMGDDVSVGEVGPGGTVLRIDSVEGRSRDLVAVKCRDGTVVEVFAREISSLVRDIPEVESAQVAQTGTGVVDLLIVAPKLTQDKCVKLMSSAIRRNRPEFAPGSVGARFVTSHVEGARGKRSVVVQAEAIALGSARFSLIHR